MFKYLLILGLSFLMVGCNPGSGEPVVQYRTDLSQLKLPETPFDYTPELPDYFTDSSHPRYVGHYDNMPANNVTTDPAVFLFHGRQ